MGGKKKKGKGKKKKGGAPAYLKMIAESPEEYMVKESISERIVIERLAIGLAELEEDNQEIVQTFHTMLHDFKESKKMDEARLQEYDK